MRGWYEGKRGRAGNFTEDGEAYVKMMGKSGDIDFLAPEKIIHNLRKVWEGYFSLWRGGTEILHYTRDERDIFPWRRDEGIFYGEGGEFLPSRMRA